MTGQRVVSEETNARALSFDRDKKMSSIFFDEDIERVV